MTETNLPTLELELHELKIRTVEHAPAIVVGPTTPIADVIGQMQAKRCGCAVVYDEGNVVGTFTERHVLACLADGADLSSAVSGHANRTVPTLSLDDTIETAIRWMDEYGVRHLPIQDGGLVAGVLSVRDVINLLSQYFPTEVLNLPPRLKQRLEKPEGE